VSLNLSDLAKAEGSFGMVQEDHPIVAGICARMGISGIVPGNSLSWFAIAKRQA
jgi:hypothetical protein